MKRKNLWQRKKGTICKILRQEQGFTMVELLAVLIILGVLAGIAIPKVSATIENSKIRACDANVLMMNSAIERYGADHLDLSTSQPNFSQLNRGTLIPAYFEMRGMAQGSSTPICPVNGAAYTLSAGSLNNPAVASCAGH